MRWLQVLAALKDKNIYEVILANKTEPWKGYAIKYP